MLEQFGMNMQKFIDVCILCGCDYTTNIPGIGPIKAYKYIEDYGCIENVLKRVEIENDNPNKKKKHHVPETFLFKEARDLFNNPNVDRNLDAIDELIKWNKPDDDSLRKFLVE